MSPIEGMPEWRGREVAARFGIGFVGGAAAVAATDQDWGIINAFGDQRFLVDRLLFAVAASIVASLLCWGWYRRPLRTTLVAAVVSAFLTLWGNEVPFVLLRAVLKPFNPDLWASLFGNPDTTLAYAPIYGLAMGVLFVLAVPVCRAYLGPAVGDPRQWAVRRPR